MLNPMQKDVLTELVNTYVAEAASLLSEMVNERILLEVPRIDLIALSKFEDIDYENLKFLDSGHIVTSSIKFGHEFSGKAFLVFSDQQAKDLVNVCLGEVITPFTNPDEVKFLDTDFDVLREISNIILNVVIGEFGNFIDLKLEYSLPEIELVFVGETEKQVLIQSDSYILILHTSFLLSSTQVKGVIMIALSMNSISLLLTKIDELLGDNNG